MKRAELMLTRVGLYGWNQLKSLSGIETRCWLECHPGEARWNQLKSLSGIETCFATCLRLSSELKSTKIPFRDWNVACRYLTREEKRWNQLKSLSGIETNSCLRLPLSCELKSTKIPFRDWNYTRWESSVKKRYAAELKSTKIPFRDWNHSLSTIPSSLTMLKSTKIPFRDWNLLRVIGDNSGKLKSTKIPFRDWNLPHSWLLLCGYPLLIRWNQLKSLSGIETCLIAYWVWSVGLKSTKIPFRDWNETIARLTYQFTDLCWNQLKSLSGIETLRESESLP